MYCRLLFIRGVTDCNEWRTEKRHECANMGKVKRLELWWQLYRTSLPVWDLRKFQTDGFLLTRVYNVSTSYCPCFGNYSIFFLQLLLSFQSSSINPFSPISPLIPSPQVRLGLSRFLLRLGRHFITPFVNLPSSILETCPYIAVVLFWYRLKETLLHSHFV